jgi:hypothetical protein
MSASRSMPTPRTLLLTLALCALAVIITHQSLTRVFAQTDGNEGLDSPGIGEVPPPGSIGEPSQPPESTGQPSDSEAPSGTGGGDDLGYCCIPYQGDFCSDQIWSRDDCFDEATGGVAFDVAQEYCSTACGQQNDFYYCSNRGEDAPPVCEIPEYGENPPDGEVGFFIQDSCSLVCGFNSCDDCQYCNYANSLGIGCTQKFCTMNKKCVAQKLLKPEAVFTEDGKLIYNTHSCEAKENLCQIKYTSCCLYDRETGIQQVYFTVNDPDVSLGQYSGVEDVNIVDEDSDDFYFCDIFGESRTFYSPPRNDQIWFSCVERDPLKNERPDFPEFESGYTIEPIEESESSLGPSSNLDACNRRLFSNDACYEFDRTKSTGGKAITVFNADVVPRAVCDNTCPDLQNLVSCCQATDGCDSIDVQRCTVSGNFVVGEADPLGFQTCNAMFDAGLCDPT